MGLFVGTSGWAYKEWKPDFYPPDLPQRRFLEHYASRLGACEINATFYRTQAPGTLDKWCAATPDRFRFAAKAHRALSYGTSLGPDERRAGFLREFLDGVARLEPKLGAVLFQSRPQLERDDDDLAALLEAIPKGAPPFAFDLRHGSWDSSEVGKAIADAGSTVCFSERDGSVPDALPPGPVAYVRLRSPVYDPEARDGWRELLAAEAATRDVYVFTKHEGADPSAADGGVGLAVWLHQTLAEGARA